MALYTSILKPNVFITLDEVAEWLNLPPASFAVPAEPTAFAPKVRELRSLLEKLINVSCDKIESMIQTSVIAKEFTETLDGSLTRVFVPSKWPILSFSEIKMGGIVVDQSNAVLRGFADRRQAVGDVVLRRIGHDIALVEDQTELLLGMSLGQTTLQLFEVKYKAGWGQDISDIPWDLRQAAVLLVEYYYFQRSNRDLNVTSKGIRGESYTKIKDGVPDTICEMIEPYISHGI